MRTLATISIVLMFQTVTLKTVCAYEPDSGFNKKTYTHDPPPQPMGTVKKLRGNVFANENELSVGSNIYPHDMIRTKEKSLMVIELADLTVITLGPSSEFKMEKWAYRTANDREGLFSLIKGQMRAHVKIKTKESDQIKFKTPTVSMGVRGTELLINVMEELNKEITQVALIEGLIHMYGNENFPAREVLPGEHFVFIKTPDRLERQKKMLLPKELNSDELNFLDPIAMKMQIEVIDTERAHTKVEKIRPWKDKLEELNRAWKKQ